MVIVKFNLLTLRINLQIYSQSPWIKKDLIFAKMSWALLISKIWINSGSGLLTGLCINWLWINKLSGNYYNCFICRQNLCVSLHHQRCFLEENDIWTVETLRSEEQVHEKDQESILTQSTTVNRISTVWESLLLELFLVKGHNGQCLATCDSATYRMSMPKEKNLHSATCHRSIRSQLVKKMFRIFSEDKYS